MLLILHLIAVKSQSPSHRYMFPTPVSGSQVISLDYDYHFLSFSGRKSPNEFYEGLYDHYYMKEESNSYRITKHLSKSSPVARSHYALFLLESRWLFLFGGLGEEGCLNDIWRFDIIEEDWTQFKTISKIIPRFNFAYRAGLDSKGHFLAIVGGIGSSGKGLQDFHLLRFSNGSVVDHEEMPSLNNGCFNSPISGAQLQFIDDNFYLFSGSHYLRSNDSYYFQGVCKFSLSSKKWDRFDMSENPLIKSSQGGSLIRENAIFYYFGRNNEGFNSKVFRLDLKELEKGWIEIESVYEDKCERSDFAFTDLIKEMNYSDYVMFIFGNVKGGVTSSSGYLSLENNSFANISCSLNVKNSLPLNRASIVQVSDSMLLFAGTNSGKFYNDVWRAVYTKDINFVNWTLIDALGTYPVPRIAHAASSQGHLMIIAGGINNEKSYLSDIWVLDTTGQNYRWIEISPKKNSLRPPPLAYSCVILDVPYFYLIGGESSDFLSADIWRYDFSDNSFEKAKISGDFSGISRHGCHLDKKKNILYIFYGAKSLDNEPSQLISFFNISTFPDLPSPSHFILKEVPGRSNFGYSVINSTLVLAGGQEFFSKSFKDVWVINLETKKAFRLPKTNTSKENFELEEGLHSMNYGTIGGRFILYSGLQGNGDSLGKQSSDSIYLIDLVSYKNLSSLCGHGTIYNSTTGKCHPCPFNYYKSDINTTCNKCESGTYINNTGTTDKIQCLPCPFGYHVNYSSREPCTKCRTNKICFAGSNAEGVYSSLFTSTQPKIVEPKSNLLFVYVLFGVTGCVLLVYVILWLVFQKLRVFLSSIDFFKNHHLDPPMIAGRTTSESIKNHQNRGFKLNFFGGFFTGASVIVFFSVLTYYSYIFEHGNILENISLVPSSAITEKKGFDKEKLKVKIGFSSLRNVDCKVKSQVTTSSNVFAKLSNPQGTAPKCLYEIILSKKSVFHSGDFVEFMIECSDCYTSDASVAVEGNAGYHQKKSRATGNISLNDGMVFKGSEPIRFFFELSPALFDDLTERKELRELGYRVSSILTPDPGSTSDLSSLYFFTNIKVKVEFTLSQTGVYTAQMLKNDNFGFIAMAFGAITGSVATLVLFMKISEYFYIRYKFRYKKVISKYQLYFACKVGKEEKKKGMENDEKIIEESPAENFTEFKSNKSNLEQSLTFDAKVDEFTVRDLKSNRKKREQKSVVKSPDDDQKIIYEENKDN